MELLRQFVDFVLHLDTHLDAIIRDYGTWTYLLLVAIVFCETGLVITPFLPGDSLLFAVGALSARPDSLQILPCLLLLSLAAVVGDTVNYWIGHRVGPRIFQRERSWLLNRRHLERTQEFYERHGGKTIIIARFVPIVRTFAPFVAGIGRMNYARFLVYNVAGGVGWVLIFVLGGFYFGNLAVVRRNFTLVIAGIVVLSILPGVIEYLRHRRRQPAAPPLVPSPGAVEAADPPER